MLNELLISEVIKLKKNIAINGIVTNVNMPHDEFWELFVWWVESNGWEYNGTTNEVDDWNETESAPHPPLKP